MAIGLAAGEKSAWGAADKEVRYVLLRKTTSPGNTQKLQFSVPTPQTPFNKSSYPHDALFKTGTQGRITFLIFLRAQEFLKRWHFPVLAHPYWWLLQTNTAFWFPGSLIRFRQLAAQCCKRAEYSTWKQTTNSNTWLWRSETMFELSFDDISSQPVKYFYYCYCKTWSAEKCHQQRGKREGYSTDKTSAMPDTTKPIKMYLCADETWGSLETAS